MPDQSLLHQNRAMIGKWSIDRYMDLIRWWVAGAAVIIIILVLLDERQEYVLLIEALACLISGWRVAQVGGGKTESITAGVLIGLGLGAAASVSRFILAPQLGWAINIVRETLLTALIAALVTVSTTLILNLRLKSTN
jgi:hypothetical protein